MPKQKFSAVYDFFKNDEFRANVLIDKYLLRDKNGNFLETSLEEIRHRVCWSLAQQTENPEKWYPIFVEAFGEFDVVPQGSVLSAIGDETYIQSISNCFVVESPEDSITGIFKTGREEASIMRRRGGVGIDISTLRPSGATVSNAARTSSGAVGWMDYFSNVCRSVGQSGRRGALILTISVKHPDAEEFAKIKQDLTKVTGANVSIKLTDEFMKAVIEDKEFIQQWPIDSKTPLITKTIHAKDLWNTICECAWKQAEPGLLFWDNIRKYLPADKYSAYQTLSCNPCFRGDTIIQTKNGHFQIEDIVGVPVEIWNGYDWSITTFIQTAENENVIRITFKNGSDVIVTPYHTCILSDGTRKEAKDLKIGDVLKASNSPQSHGTIHAQAAYLKGFLIGDGSANETKPVLFLYEPKYCCESRLVESLSELPPETKLRSDCIIDGYFGEEQIGGKCKRKSMGGLAARKEELRLWAVDYKNKFPLEVFSWDYKSKCDFIAGIMDADGTASDTTHGFLYQLTSVDKQWLKRFQILLKTIGVNSHLSIGNKAGKRNFNDGYGEYECNETWRLTISQTSSIELANQVNFSRLVSFATKKTKYTLTKRKEFTISEIQDAGTEKKVYCCIVPLYHQLSLSNGLMIGQCAELPLSSNDSCRLTTIRLTKYVQNKFTDTAYFDFNSFKSDVRIAMRMMDAIVSAEIGQIKKILTKAKTENDTPEIELWEKILLANQNGRRTGLGTHGLADCLSQLCIRYDSDKAIKTISEIYSTLCYTAYDESVEMAKEYGSFPVWDWKTEKDCEFFQHFPNELLTKMKKYGRRNISILTNAPTGSISILSGTSTGIEPTFRQAYTRRRKINPNDIETRVDFVDQVGDKWQNYLVIENNVKLYLEEKQLELPSTENKLLQMLPDYFVTSDKIDWLKRIEIQGNIQKYIDHSISSTLNIPEKTTVETVKQIYEHAWKMGLKGVTVYRENCRTGVLLSNESQHKRPDKVTRIESPKRPKILPCEVHITSVNKEEYVVIVGFLGEAVYEVFAGKHANTLPSKNFSANVVKKKEGLYILEFIDKDGQIKELDINQYFKNPNYAAITRLVSTSLRHHTPIAFVVEQLLKSSWDFTGFEKSLARVLKKYTKKEDLARKILANSGNDDVEVQMKDGCMTVINYTKNTVQSKCE